MTTARKIREYLATQDGPRTPEQIRTATQAERCTCNRSIWDMRKAGILEKVGEAYKLGRAPVERMQWEDKAERQRFHQEAKRRRMGQRTKAQYLAELRAETEAKKLKALTAKLAAENARKRAKAENAQREKVSIQHAQRKRIVDALASLPVANVETVVDVAGDVQKWLAAGNQVEVLPSQLGMAYSGLRGPAMRLY